MWLERHVYDQPVTLIASQFCMLQTVCTNMIVQDSLQNVQMIIGENANLWILKSDYRSCLEPSLINCMAHDKV